MTLRAEIKTITNHLDYFDQQNILAVIDRYHKTGMSETALKNRAISWAREALTRSNIIYLYQTEHDMIRVRISERLFDENKEIYLGSATTLNKVKEILCNKK